MPWLLVTATLTFCNHVHCNLLIFPHFTPVTTYDVDMIERSCSLHLKHCST